MKNLIYALSFISLFIACTQSSNLSLDKPINFEVLDYFTEDMVAQSDFVYYTNDNHYDEVASLGRYLFYDNRLSKNNTISCGTCHEQSKAFCDGEQFSTGLQNGMTPRNSMSLVNEMFHISYFWDGQTTNGFDRDIPVLNPVSNHVEMGMSGPAELVEKLSELETYVDLFDDIYHEPISEENIAEALEIFIESIVSENSKFDRGNTNVIENAFSNFSPRELEGMELFNSKAQCNQCHTGNQFVATWRRSANIGLDMDYSDEGAGEGRFKIPTLRNIGLTGPYMHDGRFETLEEVVDHYVNGVQAHPQLDWTLRNNSIDLTEDEQESLVAFLHTLTDYSILTDERFSNPY